MTNTKPANDKQSELEARPAYQLCSLINTAVTAGEKVTKNRPFFKDVYGDARKQIAPLKAQLNDFKKNVTQEEAARAEYTIPEALAKLNIEAGNHLEDAKGIFKQVNADDETEKAKLIASEESITNNVKKEEEKLSSMKGSKFDEDKKLCDTLRGQLTVLQAKQKDIERAIDKKHPACFPWRVKKERHDWTDVDTAIKNTMVQIAGHEQSQQGCATQEKVIAGLRKQLEVVQQSITSHTAEYPKMLNSANETVTQSQIKYEQTGIQIQKNKSRYYASLSDKSMESLVKLYALFLNYKKAIDSVSSKSKSKDIASDLLSVKGKLDELMMQLWCPGKNSQYAKNLCSEPVNDKPVANKLAVNH